jgi:hypothetical protein
MLRKGPFRVLFVIGRNDLRRKSFRPGLSASGYGTAKAVPFPFVLQARVE